MNGYDRYKQPEYRKKIMRALDIESPLFVCSFLCALMAILAVYEMNYVYEFLGVQTLGIVSLSMASFLGTLLFAGTFRQRITYRLRRKTTHFLIAGIGTGGLLLVLIGLMSIENIASYIVLLMGFMLFGSSFAIQLLLQGESSRRRATGTLLIVTYSAIALSAFIWLFVLRFFDIRFVASLLAFLPFFNAVYIFKAQHNNVTIFAPQEFEKNAEGVEVAKEGQGHLESSDILRIGKSRFALLLMRIAAPLGIAYGFALSDILHLDPLLFSTSNGSVVFATVLAMLLFVIGASRSVSFDEDLYTCRFFFYTYSALVVFRMGAPIAGFAFVLMVLLSCLVWLYPSEVMRKYRTSPLLTYGYFLSFFITFLLATMFLLNRFNCTGNDVWCQFAVAALVLVAMYLFVGDQQIQSAAKQEEKTNEDRIRQTGGIHALRCKVISDRYLLSSREAEILFLLAKGYRSAYIQKKLVISEGTVRTHMRNIYRKLDVHSQQSLTELVEQALDQ